MLFSPFLLGSLVLCFSMSNISVLILCKNVSRVLFDNLSALDVIQDVQCSTKC